MDLYTSRNKRRNVSTSSTDCKDEASIEDARNKEAVEAAEVMNHLFLVCTKSTYSLYGVWHTL